MSGLLAALRASPLVMRIGKWAVLAGMLLLFLLGVRRGGEKAGKTAMKLEALEKANVVQKAMLKAGADRPDGRDGLAGRLRDGEF